MLEQGFLRVTAMDTNGQLVADSHPDQPLPVEPIPGDIRLPGSSGVVVSEP